MSDFDRFLDDQPRALDHVVRNSGGMRNELSWAALEGAENLLEKAVRAVRAGDEGRATALIERACRMPWDDGHEMFPGPWAAHMMLFVAITDALEVSGEDEEHWLDAALPLLDGEPVVHRQVAGTLWEVTRGGELAFGEPTPHELSRIRAAIDEQPLEVDLGLTAESDVAARADMVRATLDAFIAYDDAFMSAEGADIEVEPERLGVTGRIPEL